MVTVEVEAAAPVLMLCSEYAIHTNVAKTNAFK